ncbi:MAG: hypothetical protein PHI35_05005 [Victivallaceae bacterium]|nr:hypothetical protein [Victivallaceae bacterium]
MSKACKARRDEQQWWCDAISYPFLSPRAICHNINQLEYANRLPAGHTKSKLADAFDSEMEERYNLGGIGLEELRQIRNSAWFGAIALDKSGDNSILSIPLGEYLADVTQSLLVEQKDSLVLRGPNDVTEHFAGQISDIGRGNSLFWHRLTLKLPADLLYTAFMVYVRDGKGWRPNGRIDNHIGFPPFHDEKFTDQHMHIWACMPWRLLWSNTLSATVLRHAEDYENFRLFIPGWRLNLRPLYVMAWLTRMTLRLFIDRRREGTSFREYWSEGEVSKCLSRCGFPDEFKASPWNVTLQASRQAVMGEKHILIAGFELDKLICDCRAVEHKFFMDHSNLDPLDRADDHDYSAESRLLYDCMKYVKENGREDECFASFFWNYIRCRNFFYTSMIQQEGIRGLNFFDHVFRRIKLSRRRREFSIRRIELAVKNMGSPDRLGKLEFRVGPQDSFADWHRMILWDLRNYQDLIKQGPAAKYQGPAIGFSIHFAKGWLNRRISGGKKTVPHNYPVEGDDPFNQQIRYQDYLFENWRMLRLMLKVFRACPELTFFYRGLDVANRERSVPSWVIAPLYREFRYQMRADRFESSVSRGEFMPPRMTAHAGEEFAHPVSGLRNIFEAIHFFGMESGDRIGHGVALGIDIAQWASSHNRVVVPLNEYLEDLCWEIYFYRQEEVGEGYCRLLEARDQLHELVSAMRIKLYAEKTSCKKHKIQIERDFSDSQRYSDANMFLPINFYEAYRLKYQCDPDSWGYGLWEKFGVMKRDFKGEWHVNRYCRAKGCVINSLTPPERLLYLQLHCVAIWNLENRLGGVAVTIDEEYVKRVTELQSRMRRWVANHGISVEVCPSSNRLIGDIDDYCDHPIFNLYPPGCEHSGCVSVSINSDDPLTFNTSVREEYQHLLRAAANRGMSEQLLRRWLHDISINAWQTSFVYPDNVPYESKIDFDDVNNRLTHILRKRW